MSDTIRCDGCGAVVERETLYFCLESHKRFVGGGFADPEGREHEWEHHKMIGDLCSDCAAPLVSELNDVLKRGPGDSDAGE